METMLDYVGIPLASLLYNPTWMWIPPSISFLMYVFVPPPVAFNIKKKLVWRSTDDDLWPLPLVLLLSLDPVSPPPHHYDVGAHPVWINSPLTKSMILASLLLLGWMWRGRLQPRALHQPYCTDCLRIPPERFKGQAAMRCLFIQPSTIQSASSNQMLNE